MRIGRRLSDGRLLDYEKQKELEQSFIEENQDPIDTYMDVCIGKAGSKVSLARLLDGKTTDEVYQEYKKWCEELSIRPDPPKAFTRKFSAKLPSYVKKKVISLSGAKFNCYAIDTNYDLSKEVE